jgi:Na+/H+-dicarboxylate symporter
MAEVTTTPERARSLWPPLWLQIAIALVLGAALGAAFGSEPFLGGFGNEQLGKLGMLIIRALKALTVPLVALVVLDSLLRFDLQGRQGLRLLRICALNACVAMAIGVTLVNTLRPGDCVRALFEPVMDDAWRTAAAQHAAVGPPEAAAAAAIPLVMPIDWILARLRTAINVLSDMLVAVLLDRD